MNKNSKLVILIITLSILIAMTYFYNSSPDNLPSNQPSTQDKSRSPVSPLPQIKSALGPLHLDIAATVFWIGEKPSEDNGYISNEDSFWDGNWLENYGGIDEPDNRDGFYPKNFIPKQNPFYFALPYADFDKARKFKQNITKIPWYKESTPSGQSIIKNHWIAVGYGPKICFAQWEDVGPGETDDFDYVFGEKRPRNSFSGIDLSPAVRDCLEIPGRAKVWWQFVDDQSVPNGPWKKIVTTKGPIWN